MAPWVAGTIRMSRHGAKKGFPYFFRRARGRPYAPRPTAYAVGHALAPFGLSASAGCLLTGKLNRRF